MSSSSISSSLRLFTTKIPNPKILFPHKPHNLSFSFFKPISFQRLPTNPSPPLASASSSPSASSSTPLQSIEELPPKLQEIVKLFQSVQEPKAKYEQLLFYGKNLKPLETQFKTKGNKVQGCVSQVWVRAYLDKDENVVFEADSDSVLTKGLAALLVNGLSGRPVDEVLRVSPDFAMLLGLQQSLTPSRNNGFLNMLRLMQKKALHLVVEAQKSKNSELKIGEGVKDVSFGFDSNVGAEENLVGALNSELKIDEGDTKLNFGLDSKVGVEENPVGISNSGLEVDGSVEDVNGRLDSDVGVEKDLNLIGNESNSGGLGSRGIRIKEKLEKELSPVELEIEDISYQHAGHSGARGSDGETHFNVKVVSNEFEGKSLVKRHRLVYGLLQEELQSGLHALSIVAKTPSEVNGR